MSRSLWLRFFAISVFFALLLSGLYFVLIREVAGGSSNEVQRSFYLFLAHIVEEQPYGASVARAVRYRSESPAMPLELWVIDANGKILASSTAAMPPRALLQRARPQQVHELATRGRFFSGGPATGIVRLAATEPTYLLVRNPGTPARGTFAVLASFFVVTVVGAIFLGLLMVTLYLRGRSLQAKRVIARLEAGDFGARFNTDRLDAVGGLMLNFNRMADEIQRLVTRLQTTERARRELLQELGHDLRTPLTSLRTAIETLAAHGGAMQAAERDEFFGLIGSELTYFTKLIDDLFFIAEIDEPRYRKHAEHIDLTALLASEMQAAQASARHAGRDIRFTLDPQAESSRCEIAGDPYLVSRLFRNVFDNAARYAVAQVHAAIAPTSDGIEVSVEDDGAGMSADAIALFGQRRNHRRLAGQGKLEASLGLGSVIIRTIVDLHGGQFSVESKAADQVLPGTRLTIRFPRDAAACAAPLAAFRDDGGNHDASVHNR